jgi:hypothetical protein
LIKSLKVTKSKLDSDQYTPYDIRNLLPKDSDLWQDYHSASRVSQGDITK